MIRESDTKCDNCKAKLCDEAIEVGRKFCFECGGEDDEKQNETQSSSAI